jgi:hypothetical protein
MSTSVHQSCLGNKYWYFYADGGEIGPFGSKSDALEVAKAWDRFIFLLKYKTIE